jgi:uroporphyrinogen-III synthase
MLMLMLGKWMRNRSETPGDEHRSMTVGQILTVGALHGYTVAITADRRWDEQTQLLERRGARVIHGPTIRTLPLGDEERLREATLAVIADPPDIVVFTTGLGVRSWLAGAESLGLGDELLDALRPALVLARGSKAVGAAMTAGIDVDWCTPNARNRELIDHLADELGNGRLPVAAGRDRPRVAVQLDGSPDEWMGPVVADLGFDVVAVPVYRWELPEDHGPARRVVQGVIDGSIDAVTFTAAHAVTNFFIIAAEVDLVDQVIDAFAVGSTAAVVVGPVCADRARSFGIETTIEPVTPRLGAMVRAFATDFAERRRALTLGGHVVTLQGRMARVGDGDPVLLSDREREVLAVLSDRPGVVVSKAVLLRRVWAGETDEHVVEVTVGRLRQRLAAAGVGIETVVRRGYRLSED